jgi:hypothetical protein
MKPTVQSIKPEMCRSSPHDCCSGICTTSFPALTENKYACWLQSVFREQEAAIKYRYRYTALFITPQLLVLPVLYMQRWYYSVSVLPRYRWVLQVSKTCDAGDDSAETD